jgi:putative ABC transport system permease protein
VEAIEGDLVEIFELRSLENPKKAHRQFWLDTLRFLKPRYIRSFDDVPFLNPLQMVKNYLKIGIRSLWKYRYYTGINVFGLAFGLACCLLIFLYVKHEVSYDKFYSDSDRIYRIVHTSGGGYTPARMVKFMRNDYPEIETGTRIQGTWSSVFKINGEYVKEPKGATVDSTFFDVFETKFLAGTKANALNAPNSIVLTASLADKYFPKQDAFGKTLDVAGTSRRVTAVVADPPKNTHFPYRYLMDIPRVSWAVEGYWTGNNFFSYLKLKPNVDVDFLEAKFPEFIEKYIGPEIVAFSDYESYDEYLSAGNTRGFELFPLEDIHLKKANLNFENPGNERNVLAFIVIAFLILIIACINYINMYTSRGALRAKEVGLRKVMGTTQFGLIAQFLVESVLVTVTALILSILMTVLFMPYFGDLMGRPFAIADVFQPFTVISMLLLLVVVGVLAGGYPAYYLSSFSPINALRGSVSGKGNGKLRKGMVIFQYAISLFLITVTLVVYQQVNFMSSQKIGVDKEQVYVIESANDLDEELPRFSERLAQHPNIEAAAASNQLLFSFIADWNYSTLEETSRKFGPRNMFVTKDYLTVSGIKLKEGRFFDGRQSDSASVVVNQSFIKQLKWENPIGQRLSRGGEENYVIIGVVEDFNFGSLRSEISPFLFRSLEMTTDDYSSPNYLMVKTKGDQFETVSFIEDQWNAFSKDIPMEASFLDSVFNDLFEEEKRFGSIFGSFSMLGVLIAILGLFGLVAFTMEKRYKELAIRKAMGASVINLLLLVLKDFTKLVIFGALIALPVSYYLLDDWLNDYAYRTELAWYWLLTPIILLTALTWLVVFIQSYSTTTQNPALALKNE